MSRPLPEGKSARDPALPALENRKSKIESITFLLERVYGKATWTPGRDPVDTLIGCILSQHTSDVNSGRAFDRLTRRFSAWEEVIEAPVEAVADAIRCGGLADSKAPRIQAALRRIREQEGSVDLGLLNTLSNTEARDYLLKLPAVGPKTAAIVLCFALGRSVLPVDTHVFRVAWRLGLIDRRLGEAKAHNALQALVPPKLVYRFHMALIRHGRETCRAPIPACSRCLLSDLCAYYADPSAPRR